MGDKERNRAEANHSRAYFYRRFVASRVMEIYQKMYPGCADDVEAEIVHFGDGNTTIGEYSIISCSGCQNDVRFYSDFMDIACLSHTSSSALTLCPKPICGRFRISQRN